MLSDRSNAVAQSTGNEVHRSNLTTAPLYPPAPGPKPSRGWFPRRPRRWDRGHAARKTTSETSVSIRSRRVAGAHAFNREG